jgi:hypothetical protein
MIRMSLSVITLITPIRTLTTFPIFILISFALALQPEVILDG